MLANPHLVGVIAFAAFERENEELDAKKIERVAPIAELISQHKYKLAQPLFLYVKTGQVGVVPGLKDFLAEFLSAASIGRQGYLVKRGLIPLGDSDLLDSARAGAQLPEFKLP